MQGEKKLAGVGEPAASPSIGDLVDRGVVLGARDNQPAFGRYVAAQDGRALRDLEDPNSCGHIVEGDQVVHPDTHSPLAVWEELEPEDGVIFTPHHVCLAL